MNSYLASQSHDSRSVLSVSEAADYLGISQTKLRADIQARRIPHVRLGRRLVIRVADLDALLERHLVPALS